MTNYADVPSTLATLFAAAAEAHPDARLTIASPMRPADLTLAEVFARGQRCGAHLRALGVAPGEVVAVQLPGWAEWLIACVGCAHAGAVMLPIVSIYGAKELRFILRQSEARVLFTPDVWRGVDQAGVVAEIGGALPELSRHIVVGAAVPPGALGWDALQQPIPAGAAAARTADDVALLVYTSGTTADPKGVQHSARTLLAEAEQVSWSRRALAREIALNPWPPGHVAGAGTMLRYLLFGTPTVVMDQWDAGAAALLVERHGVTCASFTPFTLSGLIDAAERDGRDIACLASCMVGAAPVPPTLIDRCTAQGLRTFRCYGSSEHPTVTVGFPDDPLEKRLTTEGRPMIGVELRFVDDDGADMPAGESGEIVTRGPDRFVGYRDAALDAQAFLPGGWYRTGDIGRFDPDGYLLITDRKKDIIIRGGENVSSREVEDLLFGHPHIAEAAVVAAPDARMGEIVCAFVIARDGAALTLDDIRAHFAAAGIAKQKTPERLMLVDDFPRTSTGKILKHVLRARLRAGGPT